MSEIVLNAEKYSTARGMVAEILRSTKKFYDYGPLPYFGDLEISYGYGKIIGIQSYDKKIKTRLDYDESKGVHYNYEDSINDIDICIPINDLSKEQYEKIIDDYNSRVFPETHEYSQRKIKNQYNPNYDEYKQMVDYYLSIGDPTEPIYAKDPIVQTFSSNLLFNDWCISKKIKKGEVINKDTFNETFSYEGMNRISNNVSDIKISSEYFDTLMSIALDKSSKELKEKVSSVK